MATSYLDGLGLTYFWGKIKNYLVVNQSDWQESNINSPGYIKNKPTITVASTASAPTGNVDGDIWFIIS